MKIPFIKYSSVWLAITAVVLAASMAVTVKLGLKLGIDFTSGSLLELSFSKDRPDSTDVHQTLERSNFKGGVIQKSGNEKLLIRLPNLTEDQHQIVLEKLRATYQTGGNEIREERFESIGPAVSQQLRKRALWAMIFVNLGIISYVAYAFRKVSRPVASWKYGLLAIVALIHDVFLVVGIFALLGRYADVEVDIGFVVALLTVLGYSVNDTIVVFDRIRENLLHHSANSFAEIVNNGLNDTLMRSINTTLTTLLPLFALYFLGGPSIHNFALALLIGIASGAYSSIFVASPLLVIVERWQRRAAV